MSGILVQQVALLSHSYRVWGSILHASYCLYGISHVLPVYMGFLQVLRFPLTSQKYTSEWTGDSKLPLSVNEDANVCLCVFGALQWIGVSSRVCSCLVPSVP